MNRSHGLVVGILCPEVVDGDRPLVHACAMLLRSMHLKRRTE